MTDRASAEREALIAAREYLERANKEGMSLSHTLATIRKIDAALASVPAAGVDPYLADLEFANKANIEAARKFKAERDAALALVERMQWRPIETAPKDGKEILTRVDWLPYAKPLFWATYANAWRCPASEDKHSYEPTHWMPMPTLPASEFPSTEGDRG